MNCLFLPFYMLVMVQENYPCLLLINDLYVGKENIPEFVANWNEALCICEERGISEIAVRGDLFLSRASRTLNILLAVHDVLLETSKKGIRVTIANGNHDKVCLESERGYCHVFDQHRNVVVVNDYASLPVGDGRYALLHLIPYFPEDGSFPEKLEGVKSKGVDRTKPNFLYLHEGINGALSQPSEKELPANLFEGFDKVFVAHYHNRCSIQGTNIEYIGSSRQHNFGEDAMKGYTVLYNDGCSDFIQNKANLQYKVIDVNVEDVNIHLTDLLDKMKANGHYRTKVRIHATATQASSIPKEKLMNAGASKVEVVTEEAAADVSASSLFEKFDSRKIRETYEEFCREKEITDVELGLSYLSKIEGVCGN